MNGRSRRKLRKLSCEQDEIREVRGDCEKASGVASGVASEGFRKTARDL